MSTVRTFERVYHRADDNASIRVKVEVTDSGKFWYEFENDGGWWWHSCFAVDENGQPECSEVTDRALSILSRKPISG